MIAEILQDQLRHPCVLVVFPRNEDLGGLLSTLAVAGKVPLISHTIEEAQGVMRHQRIQAIICEDHLPQTTLEAILKLAKHRRKPIPVIIASRTGEWEEFLRVLRQGAFDYLTLPPKQEEVRRILEAAMSESREASQCESQRTEPRPLSAGQFVLGLGEGRFEYAAPTEASPLEPPAHICLNDLFLR
jgi:DNA-binding NtrC family response regulator